MVSGHFYTLVFGVKSCYLGNTIAEEQYEQHPSCAFIA